MANQSKSVWVVAVTVLFVAGASLYFSASSDSPSAPKATTREYTSRVYRFSFIYPSRYHLEEKHAGTPERPQLATVLVENTEENLALLAGTATEPPREGPTAITVDAYQNPNGLSPEEWAKSDTNWILSDKRTDLVSVGGEDGFLFYWDGLYAGKSAVVTHGNYAYVFSVTWITAHDRIVRDFETLLKSVKFL